ncbi:MAG: 5-dehydro-4-deoxy-D-glucuronate isomerase [Ignavibacteria bacterium]|nr:5-dehydro-4-deoxy-D-glucuronate isomerase [Ignavibacteria bacterium]
MDVRFSTDPEGFRAMTTEELRKAFLIDHLFVADEVPMFYSDIDRSITGSALPAKAPLRLLSTKKELAAEHFAERREIGVINIGMHGIVKIDGREFAMAYKDALYIGRGAKDIEFASKSANEPAMFYFVSYPAHKELPTTHAKFTDAEPASLGTQKDANKRTIYKYIHPNGIRSCQLVMGLTELEEGSVWNTMPPHTHQRRSEVYMYFNIDPNAMIVHLLGQPDETRHIVIRNRQAVLNPSWSIHAGVGTQNYTFIWAMGGENQVFDDMDSVKVNDLT